MFFYRLLFLLIVSAVTFVPLHAQEAVRYHQVSLQAVAAREIVPDRI